MAETFAYPWLDLSDQQLLDQCRVTHTRRSGPGGQHRNKVSTAVVIEHVATGVRAEASERRSQAANRDHALARLRLRLALEIRRTTGPIRTYRPSRAWRDRLRGERVVVSATHRDFPRLLAEALDVLAAVQWHVSEAAGYLGCSSSQLVKLLKAEPAAMSLLNTERLGRGLKPLA